MVEQGGDTERYWKEGIIIFLSRESVFYCPPQLSSFREWYFQDGIRMPALQLEKVRIFFNK